MSQVISYIICKVFKNTIIDENCFDHSTRNILGRYFSKLTFKSIFGIY